MIAKKNNKKKTISKNEIYSDKKGSKMKISEKKENKTSKINTTIKKTNGSKKNTIVGKKIYGTKKENISTKINNNKIKLKLNDDDKTDSEKSSSSSSSLKDPMKKKKLLEKKEESKKDSSIFIEKKNTRSKNKTSIKKGKKNIDTSESTEDYSNNDIESDSQKDKHTNKRSEYRSTHAVEKNNRILEIRTSQTGALKQVIEMLSNVLTDCTIVFIPHDNSENDYHVDDDYEEYDENNTGKENGENNRKKNKITEKKTKKTSGGIRILRLTEDKNILLKLNLEAANFEYFFCAEKKISIGVDMNHFHALLKTVSDDNPVTLYMNRDNRSALYIRSVNEKDDSSEETDIELVLMEIANPEMPLDSTEFQNKVTIASDKFHTICKHLNNNSALVEITSVGNQISFRGKNDGGKVTMSYKDTHQNEKKHKKKYVEKKQQVVQGEYELRNLMSFSKCNKLCNTIDIFLKNDFPLVLMIAVANLGKLFVFLTPIENKMT